MGFNLKKTQELAVKTFPKTFDVPVELGGGEIGLTVKFITRAQIEQVENKLRDVAEKDRTRVITEAIRQVVINNLTAEPTGLDDFPNDARSLTLRAREYFAQAAKETDTLDGACLAIWNDFKEATRLKPTNKSLPADLPGDRQSQNGAPETIQ